MLRKSFIFCKWHVCHNDINHGIPLKLKAIELFFMEEESNNRDGDETNGNGFIFKIYHTVPLKFTI